MSKTLPTAPLRQLKHSSLRPYHPLRSSICPSCAHRRQFTTTDRQSAGTSMQKARTNVDDKLPKSASMKSMTRKAPRSQLTTDLGRLPQTLILPPSSQLPSFTTLRRWKILYLKIKTSLKDLGSLYYLSRWDVKRNPLTQKREKLPMRLDERLQAALALHTQFLTALGQGDRKTLQQICCEGIMYASHTRIQRRISMRENLEPWTLVAYNGIQYPSFLQKWPLTPLLPFSSTRVLADRLAPLPFAHSSVRQVTVRIRSTQEVHLANTPAGQGPTRKDVTDYIIIQKMTMKGDEGEWKIWGLAEPCDEKEIDKLLEGKGEDVGSTLMDRMTATFAGRGGL